MTELTPMPPGTPAGWHDVSGEMRYWDGNQWTTHTAGKPKKKRRIFLWFFLAVQVLFIIWIIAGASTGSGQPSDCGTLDAKTCNDASDAGTAIGVALIIVFWAVVDVILGVIYGVYRLAKRN